MECFFESFGLPTIDFIKSFRETFPGPKSLIALSPDVGSDQVRKMHKGNAYTNQDLMGCLDQLKEHGVFCDLFFILGVPFEKEEDVCQTARLQREVRNRYPNVRGIRTYTAQMEPGSPWHLDPESFRVETSLKNFLDFYHYHSGEESSSSSLGYWIPGYFQDVKDEIGFEERLQDIKCRYSCFMHPNAGKASRPFWGRRSRDLSSVFWKMKHLARGKM
jgi:radical SAM superfamily enzyme YgiQ (UPF0313 family)